MVKQRKGTKPNPPKKRDVGPPAPFKRPPEVLQPLIDTLEEKHIYILHVDNKPAAFKRKIFMVPVLMNVAIVGLFAWRVWYILPWYLSLLASTLGYPNETTMVAAEMDWSVLLPEILRRSAQFMVDLLLYFFIWPWPLEFTLGKTHGSPVGWRWSVGFRDQEIVARRSRGWDTAMGDLLNDENARSVFSAYVGVATAPMHLQDKTGYLLMNSEWDLDWGVMIDATKMVDEKMAALDAFRLVVLVFQEDYGWMSLDMKLGNNAAEDERRRQIFMFRDALAAIGKDDLFFRWIEIIQFESTQPGGFGPEKQEVVAKQVRDLFQKEDIDFDEFWKQSVGTETMAGL